MKKKVLIVASILVAAAVAFWVWWSPADKNLSDKPPRSVGTEGIAATESSIAVSAVIRYAAIANAMNKVAPVDFSTNGRQNVCVNIQEQVKKTVQERVGGDVGKLLGEAAKFVTKVITINQTRHVCQDIDYTVSVHRDGPFTVTPIPGAIRVSVPVSVSGTAGFTGDVANVLKLDKKNFRGSITAFADVSMDIGSNWCPTVQVRPDFVWRDKAQLEIAGRFWIDVDGSVGPKLKDTLNDAAKKLPDALGCGLKDMVARSWHPYSFQVSDLKDAPLYVNLTPGKVGFSGVQYENNAVRLALAANATAEVSTMPIPSPVNPPELPPLTRISATSNKLRLSVPLRARYDDLRSAAGRLILDRDFSGATPAGHATVRIKEIEIYPAGKSLVLGLRFDAKVERKILDAKGWVYLIAEPLLDKKNQMLRLGNVKFTREVDNKLWAVLSAIFREQIQKELEEKAVVDLKPGIAALRTELQNKLSALGSKQGIVLKIKDDFIGLEQIHLADKDLEVVAGFEGTADITEE